MIWKEQSQKNDTNLGLNHYINAGINLFCRDFAHQNVKIGDRIPIQAYIIFL